MDLDRVRLDCLADRDLRRDRDLERRRCSRPEGDLERLLCRKLGDLDLVLLPCRDVDLRRLGDRDLDFRCDRFGDGDLDLCCPGL